MSVRDWLASCGQDVKFASRQFRRAPGFVVATVLTLTLGIGGTSSVFSVTNGVLLRPLPFPSPDRIVQLWELDRDRHQLQFSDPNFDDVRSQSHSFDGVAEVDRGGPVSVAGDIAPVRATMVSVSHDFFDVMGAHVAAGRTFSPEEEHQGGAPVAVVSWAFVERVLGEQRNPIGVRLTSGGQSFTVIGVLGPDFEFPANADLWVSREIFGRLPSRTAHNWQVVARLRPGVTLERARRDVGAVARTLAAQYGNETLMADVGVVPLREQLVGSARPTLLILLAASTVLLLIACANVANLLVARMTGRRGELAVRMALGAVRARLIQQCLVESTMLALTGGAIGLALAAIGTPVLLALDPSQLPRSGDVRVDAHVVLYALGVSMVTAVGLALITAWRAAHGDVREMLAGSQRSASGPGSATRTRHTLVVVQIAMTMVLLVAAGLLGRSFIRLAAVNPGFRTEEAVVLDLAIESDDSLAIARRAEFYRELLVRLDAIPGVTAVGAVNAVPLDRSPTANGTFIKVAPGEQVTLANLETLGRDHGRTDDAEFRVASGGYFGAMHIPLLEGRTFDDRDIPSAPHVAVISASLARRAWPGTSPIGQWVEFGNMDGDIRPFTIVGVVGDIREAGLAAPPRPTVYANYFQRPISTRRMNFVMTGRGDPASMTAAATAIVRVMRPDIPPRFRTIESIVASSVADRRLTLLLVGVFGVTALLLATLGVYSVISYLVAQRAQELSIRLALGARAQDIAWLVVRQGATLTGIGIAIGTLVAFAATRVLAGSLYGITTRDPIAFGSAVLIVSAIALLACWMPARRAARVHASETLRAS